MATVLRLSERTIGGGRVTDPATLQAQPASYGQGILPSSVFTLASGTGTGQASKWYLARRALAGTTFDLLDLAGGLTDYAGASLTFSAVKRCLVAVVSPDGTKKLRVGPQDQSNAWQGWFGGTGATVYEEVFHTTDRKHPYAGWTVTGGSADVLAVYNPGATSVTYAIWIIGV